MFAKKKKTNCNFQGKSRAWLFIKKRNLEIFLNLKKTYERKHTYDTALLQNFTDILGKRIFWFWNLDLKKSKPLEFFADSGKLNFIKIC